MSSDAIELPPVPIIAPEIREANAVPSQANAVTAIIGLSGGGKSALADTAAEFNFETYGGITLCYASDPGGFGTKRLAMIRAGIMRVWDPRNHKRFFETMEAASLGGWPEHIEDPERGYADPDVKIIMPRRLALDLICPQGHVARRFDNEAVLNAISAQGGVKCATCGLATTLGNATRVDRLILRHPLFKNVTGRIFDSLTAVSDQGLVLELPTMSATNQFAKTNSGGSALGSADAFTQGTVTYGTGSEAQVGFMQNRVYGWLMNIRQIPDAKTPTIVTFGLEESKKDDESGGLQVIGPKIAGKARTSAVPGWVGNLLVAAHEPDKAGNMVYRLWLTTHVDPRDPRKMPILAKTRGAPLGIDCLEDPWDPDPLKRKANAWSVCSMKVLFTMLNAQVAEIEAALRAKYPNAPGFQPGAGDVVEAVDEIVQRLTPRVAPATPPSVATTVGVPVTTGGAVPAGAASAGASPAVAIAGGAGGSMTGLPQMVRRARPAAVTAPIAAPSSPSVPSVQPAGSGAVAAVVARPTTPPAATTGVPSPTAPSEVEQQLRASLAAAGVEPVVPAVPAVPAVVGVGSSAVISSGPPIANAPRVVRRPRPPTS